MDQKPVRRWELTDMGAISIGVGIMLLPPFQLLGGVLASLYVVFRLPWERGQFAPWVYSFVNWCKHIKTRMLVAYGVICNLAAYTTLVALDRKNNDSLYLWIFEASLYVVGAALVFLPLYILAGLLGIDSRKGPGQTPNTPTQINL